MPPPALWTFSMPPAARAPHVMLIVFGVGPLADDVPLSLSTFGLPSADHVALLDVRTIGRAADPAWFDGWRGGALRTIASGDLGDGLAALDAADHAHVIAAEPEAPADLGSLQAAWGMARALAARGADVVLDVHAMTFRVGNRLPPAGAGLGVARELRVVFESDSTRQDGAHALHTRGMRKFGAPDLVALCSPPDAQLVASVIEQLADVVARGGELALPRHGVDLDERTSWYAVADEHGLADLLGLDNDARVLVDDHGHHLAGVLARLRAERG
jgi:hypothetical protein